ncbi:hypothetical protein NGB36_06970 [Streptomyces sp. RB6PN25]|uniref:Integrase n=1 Tax=Streptomyces humicola TaxID=2953240 RepID=A0ABT1PRP4_9ACTN|nr:hypothetical protein [Streptomyces humicola]MCQ4080344.1 hypothetical protein [Streptomyces humicola]
MRIETATEPGSPQRPDEDFAAVALPASGQGGTLVLLDGVTPHRDGTGCVHGVPWYVARLGGALLELSASRRDLTLADCLAESIARTAAAHAGTCELSHTHTPQSTVVLARWDEEAVEHLVLSDSVLLIEGESGDVRAVLDDRLDRMPEQVRAMRAAVRAMERGSAEREAAGAAYGRAVEALRNAVGVEGAFFTAAADPAVARLAVTGTTPRRAVRAVAALTDGAGRLVEVFHEGGWADAFALLRKEGPQGLITRVRAAESADPTCTAYPRGKRHDDATAILAVI